MQRSLPLDRVLLSVALAVTTAWACSDGGTSPPTPVPTTVTLNRASVALDALGATEQLTATVKDQSGNTMSASVTWTPSNSAVASVSTSGLVTAVAAGTAQITATAGSVSASASVTVTQVSAQVVKAGGDAQSATVGQALGQALVARVNDRLGNAIAGVTVNFTVSANGGSVSPGSGMTDAGGQISTQWTLGTLAGAHTVTAAPATGSGSASFVATATADAADSLLKVSGDGQTGLVGAQLGTALVVKVVDQYKNAVASHAVVFSAGAGSGSVTPTNATTSVTGEASTVWTLGGTVGSQSAEASAGGLKGDPVTFGATATSLSLTAVSPDTVVEGSTATLTGTGFSTTPANNAVTIDGIAVTVTAASATSLTVTVPTFDCRPARGVDVQVSVGGSGSNTVNHPLRPSDVVNLAVGEMMMMTDPAAFCLQFTPAAAGGDQYLVGVGAAAELPTSYLSTLMTGVQGASPAGPALAPLPASVRRAPAMTVGALAQEYLERRAAHDRAEARLRAWEREHLDPAKNPALRTAVLRSPAASMAVPDSGDLVKFRVPDADGPDYCDYTEIDAVVKYIGQAGIFVADTNNPVDSLTDAEIKAYSDTFDILYETDTVYFGRPSDIDQNDRVYVVLTVEVNKLAGGFVAGFVFAGDLFDRAYCATSDGGEIFYSHVPDGDNAAGTIPRTKAAVLWQMPSLIAHEFAHNIQDSRRFLLSGNPGARQLSSWEAEGQATLAEEVVGHRMLGRQPGQDYGASVALAGQGARWYGGALWRLANYYGWNDVAGRNANAPEECTLFGNLDINSDTPCESFWFYGSSWSFQRYVLDRFGKSFAGGDTALARAWIDGDVTLNGVENVEALLGVQFDTVFARWAAMHYVDGRIAAADTSLQMRSWDIDDVMSGLNAAAPLAPVQQAFGDFSVTETIRGGSTAYTLLTTGSPRPALALRVRNGSDQVLGTTMKPQLWIVRVQ